MDLGHLLFRGLDDRYEGAAAGQVDQGRGGATDAPEAKATLLVR